MNIINLLCWIANQRIFNKTNDEDYTNLSEEEKKKRKLKHPMDWFETPFMDFMFENYDYFVKPDATKFIESFVKILNNYFVEILKNTNFYENYNEELAFDLFSSNYTTDEVKMINYTIPETNILTYESYIRTIYKPRHIENDQCKNNSSGCSIMGGGKKSTKKNITRKSIYSSIRKSQKKNIRKSKKK